MLLTTRPCAARSGHACRVVVAVEDRARHAASPTAADRRVESTMSVNRIGRELLGSSSAYPGLPVTKPMKDVR